jgi:hypothetical protein
MFAEYSINFEYFILKVKYSSDISKDISFSSTKHIFFEKNKVSKNLKISKNNIICAEASRYYSSSNVALLLRGCWCFKAEEEWHNMMDKKIILHLTGQVFYHGVHEQSNS